MAICWCLERQEPQSAINVTGLAGLEPTTYGLGNRRSIRLSYSPMATIIPRPPAGLAKAAKGFR